MQIAPKANAAVSTDVVIFTIRAGRLCVLLVRRVNAPYAGLWSLPGGVVEADEALEDSALRVLLEKTGVQGVYLEQLYTFGQPGRDPRGRVLTVAYYALVPYDRLHVRGGVERLDWFPEDELPPLAFDHRQIVGMARRRLSGKLNYSTIALQFMPEAFTLSELQGVYETILGERLDKRNFRKRLQALDCLEDTGTHYNGGHHRPARLYRAKSPGEVRIIG